MTIPGVGQLTALAFVAAIDDPSRIRRSRDVGAYLGLVPRRYQSGEVDYTGGISKCGDRRVRTLLYEAANVMLTRYKGQLKLKDWAFAIAKRSTMRKATYVSRSRPGPYCLLQGGKHRHSEVGFRRSMTGLRYPLSTLRFAPHGSPRMTWGRCGSLRLLVALSPGASCCIVFDGFGYYRGVTRTG